MTETTQLKIGPPQFLIKRRKAWWKPWTWRTKYLPVEGVMILSGEPRTAQETRKT